jgi:hypothetical protein
VTILYAPMNQQQPQQNMLQPNFYMQQQVQKPSPTTNDFIASQLQRLKQRPAPPSLTPGSRAVPVDRSIADAGNFQSYYKQLGTIKQIGQEQVARAGAEAAMARLQASQALSGVSGGVHGGPVAKVKGGPGAIGSGLGGSLPSNPKANFQYAQNIASNYGWGSPAELAAWYTLGMKESGWRSDAKNKTSTAFGIGQFLDSTWAGYGIPKTSNPALQVEAMARYIKARYGSPSKALAFHIGHNWY